MDKLTKLKNKLNQDGLDAFIITNPLNRVYLSNFTGTNGTLIITKTDAILITDFRYIEQAAQQSPEFLLIQYQTTFTDVIKDILFKHGLKRVGIDKDDMNLATFFDLKEKIPNIDFIPTQDYTLSLRRIKSQQEISILKKAVEIADKAFLHIINFIKPGYTEHEIAIELEFIMKRLGAEKTAFNTIVASGERSALPHGIASSKIIKQGELVTLDFGAVYQGYHSDITRTLIVGEPNLHQQEIYNLVLKAQEEAEKKLSPGIIAKDADAIARQIIQDAGFGENFGHGLGHGVGLDIHEGPRLAPTDNTVLEPGMVISVEPGIYISGWGGIRIEDLVVITNEGCEILTKSPKSIATMSLENK